MKKEKKRRPMIIKDYINSLKQLNYFVLVIIIALSVISSYFIVNPIIDKELKAKIPDCIFTLEVLEETNPDAYESHEVWLTGISLDENADIRELFNIAENSGFEFRNADEYGYSCDVIVNIEGSGSTLSIPLNDVSHFSCGFWQQNLSGTVNLTVQRGDEIIKNEKLDLYSDQPDTYVNFYTEIPEYYFGFRVFVFRIVLNLLLAVLFFFIITLLTHGLIIYDQKEQYERKGP